MGFPSRVKEDALILCARHCCLCHKSCGLKIEVHHIKQQFEGGTDDLENAIPLCFDCHGDMRSYDHKHPIGNKYTTTELIRRRDEWYAIVKRRGIRPEPETSPTQDLAVFAHLVKLLPWDGSINFIRNNNFAGFPFDCDRLRDLDAFVAECSNPSFAFSDSELEALRAQLITHINLFNRAIGYNTFRVGTGSWNSVPSEWEINDPEHFEKAVNSIHDAATSTVETYDLLAKAARKNIGAVSLA